MKFIERLAVDIDVLHVFENFTETFGCWIIMSIYSESKLSIYAGECSVICYVGHNFLR